MPRAEEDLKPYLVRLFSSDIAYLQSTYADTVGVNKVIRTMVHAYVRQIKAKADKAIDDIETSLEPLEPS